MLVLSLCFYYACYRITPQKTPVYRHHETVVFSKSILIFAVSLSRMQTVSCPDNPDGHLGVYRVILDPGRAS